MKKVVTLLLTLFLALNAESLSIPGNIEQKTIKDLKSYNEFVSVMKKVINLGDTTKAYVLGVLYLKDFPFAKSNKQKAIKYFKIALANSYTSTQAAFYLSGLEEPLEALGDIEHALKNATNAKQQKMLTLRYLEIVLTDFYKNRVFLEKAYNSISPYVYKINNPMLDFAYAHLLLLLNKTEMANKFLNSACNNPNATKELLDRCFNNPNLIKVKNEKGVIVNKPKSCGSCKE